MIDVNMSNAINDMNTREQDAMGYTTPGYQATFHAAMESKQRSTGVPDPLSVSAPSLTFFVVQNSDGSRAYTRAGNFQIRDGHLTTSDGRQVMGYPEGRTSGSLIPMTVPAGTPDGWVNIAADGTVSVADPKDIVALDRGNSKLAMDLDGRTGQAALPPDDGAALRSKAQQNYAAGAAAPRAMTPEEQALSIPKEAIDGHPEVLDANMSTSMRSTGNFAQSLTAPSNVVAPADGGSDAGTALNIGIGTAGPQGNANAANLTSSNTSIQMARTANSTSVTAPSGAMLKSGDFVTASGTPIPTAVQLTTYPNATTVATPVNQGPTYPANAAVNADGGNANGLSASTLQSTQTPAGTGRHHRHGQSQPAAAVASPLTDATAGESPADAAADQAADARARAGQTGSLTAAGQTVRGAASVTNASAATGGAPLTAPPAVPTFLAGEARGAAAPAMGKPIGRLALARFGFGTTVNGSGVPSSGFPVEVGVAKSGNIQALRTNSRDLGNVDAFAANSAISDAGSVLNAVMTAEQSAQNRAKKAMDLIK